MKAILSTSKLFMALGICTLSACVMIGCVDKDKDYSQPSDGSNLNSFTFSTTQEIQLAVKYAIPAKDYQVLFEVYFENPFENKDGQIVKRSDVEPKVIRMTDGNGNYAGKEVLPGYLLNEGEEVYIYTSYIGVPTLYKTTVQGNMIRADINWDTM